MGLSRWFYNRTIDTCESHKIYNFNVVHSLLTKKTSKGNDKCTFIPLPKKNKKNETKKKKNDTKNEKEDEKKEEIVYPCNALCTGLFCDKHVSKPNSCQHILDNDNLCKVKCVEQYCHKHLKQKQCIASLKGKPNEICGQPCIDEYCSRHDLNRRVSQYGDVMPDWYADKDYIPRFITGAIHDCTKAYSSAFSLLRNSRVDKFKMNYKTKKDRYQTLYVEKTCFGESNRFLSQFFKTTPLQFGCMYHSNHKNTPFYKLSIDFDGRIQYDTRSNKWYYIYTFAKKLRNNSVENQDTLIQPQDQQTKRIIALDSGSRTFQTGYSPNGHVVEFETRKNMTILLAKQQKLETMYNTHSSKKLKRKLEHIRKVIKNNDKLGGLLYGYYIAQYKLRCRIDKCKNKRKRHVYWTSFYRLSLRIERMVDDFHWRIIKYLTSNYDCITLGDFKTSQILKRLPKYMKATKRNLTMFRHYTFKSRLQEKCKEMGVVLHIQNEAYTSKTCSCCGWHNANLGCCKIFKCEQCHVIMDRDINAARNIYMRSWFECIDFRYLMRASATISK
jgi:IS605 OrfB family transposase